MEVGRLDSECAEQDQQREEEIRKKGSVCYCETRVLCSVSQDRERISDILACTAWPKKPVCRSDVGCPSS